MNIMKKSLVFIILIIILLLYTTLYVVKEGERALILRLGEIVTTSKGQPKIMLPGLHFKFPFIYKEKTFDVRLQTLAVQSSRVLTVDQKAVLVDYYIKWRINDLPLYYQRTRGDSLRAEALLQQQVNDALRATFGKRSISDVVSGERLNIMTLLKDRANFVAQNLGIWVADVRIKSIDLPKEVSGSVYNRMSTKREEVATEHRAAGRARAEEVRARADAVAAVTVAEAKTKAAILRAQGQAQAAEIYANAYNQDTSFFEFYRTLEAYRNSFTNKNDILLLTPDSQFFNYFNNQQGK